MSQLKTTELQLCLDRVHAGDAAARNELVEAALKRFRHLAHKLLQDFPAVRRRADTDDVLQTALLKLHGELQRDVPPSLKLFFWRTGKYVRQSLVDLAREHRRWFDHHATPDNLSASSDTTKIHAGAEDESDDPGQLAAWTELHDCIDSLPEELRQMFDLLWYQELTQAEAAEVLGIDRTTVTKRWQAARLTLSKSLRDVFPSF